jgi:hypothetical protein
VRRDWAQYYDRITMMDRAVGANLRELEEACHSFNLLSATTAERVLRFWQVRNAT